MSKEFSVQYEQKILSTWEEVYKKGQLTLWLLLSLKGAPKHMSDIKRFVEESTNNTLSADDQSVYRSLRRLYQMELVDYQEEPSTQGGPSLKVYRLTELGQRILTSFIHRNIAGVFYQPEIKKLILEGEKYGK